MSDWQVWPFLPCRHLPQNTGAVPAGVCHPLPGPVHTLGVTVSNPIKHPGVPMRSTPSLPGSQLQQRQLGQRDPAAASRGMELQHAAGDPCRPRGPLAAKHFAWCHIMQLEAIVHRSSSSTSAACMGNAHCLQQLQRLCPAAAAAAAAAAAVQEEVTCSNAAGGPVHPGQCGDCSSSSSTTHIVIFSPCSKQWHCSSQLHEGGVC
jgi:hypothetical protein